MQIRQLFIAIVLTGLTNGAFYAAHHINAHADIAVPAITTTAFQINPNLPLQANQVFLPTPSAVQTDSAASDSRQASAQPTIATAATLTPATGTVKMTHFGVLIRPYGLKSGPIAYSKDQLTAQLDAAGTLGATDVRANVEQEDATNDDVVNESLARGFKITLILEPPAGYLDSNTYQRAFDYAHIVATRYLGKVSYYQLLNEASGASIRPGFPGNKTSDYDAVKYQQTKDAIRGLSEGVRSVDKSAGRIVSANWVGTGIIDKLAADQVPFEIIGWNWYSDMGDDLIKKVDTRTTLNIPEYLKKYGKPFWVVEANRRQGSADLDYAAQSAYLQTLFTNVASHHNVQGFFVFQLADECGALDQEHGHLGLIGVTKQDSGNCTLSDPKPAFTTFKDLIRKNK